MKMDNYRVLWPLTGAIVFAGVTGYLVYLLFKDDEEDEDSNFTADQEFTSVLKTVEVKIPKNIVGVVIGRQGANVKLIQKETFTNINFRDDGVDERTCVIRGQPENVKNAKELILKCIQDIPRVYDIDILVPQAVVGKIIGRGGLKINQMSKLTGAKIIVEKTEYVNGRSQRKVNIRGTAEQVEAAKSWVLETVKRDEEMKEKGKSSALDIASISKDQQMHQNPTSQDNDMTLPPVNEVLLPMIDERFEAYVAAVDTASHFWIQIVNQGISDLHQLVTSMTEYYGRQENQTLHFLKKENVKIGTMVSAIYPLDRMWYRGRIVPHELEDDTSQVVVYFVDFGDTDVVDYSEILELKTDFLKLNFQAVECYLANVDHDSTASRKSTEAFADMVHVAQWESVIMNIISYSSNGKPYVKIINQSGRKNFDVAIELVRAGLAKWTEPSCGPVSIPEDNQTLQIDQKEAESEALEDNRSLALTEDRLNLSNVDPSSLANQLPDDVIIES